VKAIVTGATGFIGRRLVGRLREEGTEVVAVVRTDRHGLPEGVQTVCGDILSPESLKDIRGEYDYLYHLAAMITFDAKKREDLIRVNGQGTLNILEAAKRWSVRRSVVVSSACTMGLSYSQDHVLDEEAPVVQKLVKANPYMESKLVAEKEAAYAAEDQTVVIVNPTTAYGPGDWTLNSGTMVTKIARSAVVPIPPGGSNVVDVDDVVQGILLAGERGQSGHRYILGGENLSFAQIFFTITSVVGRRPLMVYLPRWMRKPMSVSAWVAGWVVGSRFLTPQIIGDMFAFKYYSSRRAEQELGWSQRYSFRDSIERAWSFYQREGLVS
jgi:dihydroflavonol-4-reductase